MKAPAVCPKCGTEQPPEQPRPRRAGGNVVEEKRRAKVVPVPGLDDADTEGVEAVAEEESDEDVLEDTSDLEGGDDVIADVEVEVESDNPDADR